jgi:hypothetical protein
VPPDFSGFLGVSFAFVFITPLLLSLAIPYLILRYQDARSPDPDPHLGMKAVLYFVFSLGVMLALLGLTVLLSDALEQSDLFNDSPSRVRDIPGPRDGSGRRSSYSDDWRDDQRRGSALLVAGVAVSLLHLVLILVSTNDLRRPGVRRVFIGYRLAAHGLVNLGAFTLLLWLLFSRDVRWTALCPPLAALIIWGPSWIVHLVLLRFAARGGTQGPRVPDLSRFAD